MRFLCMAYEEEKALGALSEREWDEGVRIASKWPSARLGSIEVRPILEALRPGRRYGGAGGRS
jgi:hypothetical protein